MSESKVGKLPSSAVILTDEIKAQLRDACARPSAEEQIKALQNLGGSIGVGDRGASRSLTWGVYIDALVNEIRYRGYSKMYGTPPSSKAEPRHA